MQAGVGVAYEAVGWIAMAAGDYAGAATTYGLQCIGAGADDQVAGQQQIGLLRVDADLVEEVGPPGPADERQYGAPLLGEAHEVELGAGHAIQVRRHAHQCADGHDARAAYSGDQHVVWRFVQGEFRQGKVGDQCLERFAREPRDALPEAAALDRNETRAETLDA